MLPGFRFLFAAILLSTSVLIFGLGAAALLRAAHEEVASAPARRAPPERVFAQQNDPVPRHWPVRRVNRWRWRTCWSAARGRRASRSRSRDSNAARRARNARPPVEPEEFRHRKRRSPDRPGSERGTPAPRNANCSSRSPPPRKTTADRRGGKCRRCGAAPAPASESAAPAAPEQTRCYATPESALRQPRSQRWAALPSRFRKRHRQNDRRREARPDRGQEAGRGAARRRRFGERGTARGRRPSSKPPIHSGCRRQLRPRPADVSDHAGPVASGGPSGRPHSAHEPS